MVKAMGEKRASRIWWEQLVEHGLSVDDFFAKIAVFEDALPGFEIEQVAGPRWHGWWSDAIASGIIAARIAGSPRRSEGPSGRVVM